MYHLFFSSLLLIHQVDQPTLLVELVDGFIGPSAVAAAPNGRIVAVDESELGQVGRIVLYEVATGQQRAILPVKHTFCRPIAFSPDGNLLGTLDEMYDVRVWDLVAGSVRFTNRTWTRSNLVFSPDGKLLFANKSGSLDLQLKHALIWDTATGKEIGKTEDTRYIVEAVAVSPDGKLLATCGGDTDDREKPSELKIWDLATRTLIQDFTGQAGPVTCMRFVPGSKFLAVGTKDSKVTLWDIETRKRVHILPGHARPVCSLAVSVDGQVLAVGTDKAEMRIWELGPKPKVRCVFQNQGIPLGARDDGTFCGVVAAEFVPGGERLLLVIYDSHAGECGVFCINTVTGKPDRFFDPSKKTKVVFPEKLPAADSLSPAELRRRWNTLAEEDAAAAYRTIRAFIHFPNKSLPLLAKELSAVPAVNPRTVEQFIADLDNDEFSVREKARHALENLAEIGEPALQKALKENPSAEKRRQIGLVFDALEKYKRRVPPPERLRLIRALEILEAINTDDARKLVTTLGEGEPAAWLTKEAKAVRDRMMKRPLSKP